MSESAARDSGYTVESYFGLVGSGLLEPEDHVELLEGLIVASPPQGPLHASVTMAVDQAVRSAVGTYASVRNQLPLIAGERSAPEPDLAVVPGTPADYRDAHPTSALLVIEIADSSLPQERLTKSRIYARCGVPEYWIVNIRDRCVEVHRSPDPATRTYRAVMRFDDGDEIELAAVEGAKVSVSDLFPGY